MPGKSSKAHRNETEALASSGLSASIQIARQWLNIALDLIYPPRCMGCGRIDTNWCSRCQHELMQTDVHVLAKTTAGDLSAAATGIHEGKLQSAVQALKYGGEQALAGEFARRLHAALQILDWSVDVIIPVPMHIDRLKKRGYNQAALIARSLAEIAGLEYTETAISRPRATRSQVGLSRLERLQNVGEAFIAYPAACQGRSFLIVDDVLTTGATLAGCASALYDAGAAHACGLTVTTARLERQTLS